jgi:ribonuclease HI
MCLRRGIRIGQLNIRADSMLAVNHVNGVWKCRNEKLVPLFMKVKKFGTPKSVQHVYRIHNKRADELANQGVLL